MFFVPTIRTWPQTIRPVFFVKACTRWSSAGLAFGSPIITRHWGLWENLWKRDCWCFFTSLFCLITNRIQTSTYIRIWSPEVFDMILYTSEMQTVGQCLVVHESLCGRAPVYICSRESLTKYLIILSHFSIHKLIF